MSDELVGSKENDEEDPPAKRSRVADEEEGAEVCRSVFSIFFCFLSPKSCFSILIRFEKVIFFWGKIFVIKNNIG